MTEGNRNSEGYSILHPTEEKDDNLAVEEAPRGRVQRCVSWVSSWDRGTWIRIGIIVIILGVFIALVAVPVTRNAIKKPFLTALTWIRGHKLIGSFAFIGLYIVATVCLVPGSILTLGGGFVFGLWLGTLLVWIGSTIGATLAYLLGRSLLRNWVASKIKGNTKFMAVDTAIDSMGWFIVLLVRLAPIIPFNLLNYALALTKVKVWQYIVFSAIGMLPGTVMYVYFGSLVKNIADLAGGVQLGKVQIIIWCVSGVVIIAVVVITTIVARKAFNKAILNQELGQGMSDTDLSINKNQSSPPSWFYWFHAPLCSSRFNLIVLLGALLLLGGSALIVIFVLKLNDWQTKH